MLKQLQIFYYFYETDIVNNTTTDVNTTYKKISNFD
jgi:hypothetical protein